VQEAGTFKDYTLIKAPQQGVVAERRVAVGDVAQPGQPLITLYDPQQLQIEGEVNDSHRDLVKVGLAVRASVPAVNYQGELSLAEVFPISAAGSRTFRVRTAMIREAEVVPGMFARLEIPLSVSRGILIPAAAVRQVGQLDLVEAVVDGRATRRQVKLGRQMGDKVEVLAGLQAGDRILY
jgi:RND family efflux transporter MFP subunit